ncbi:hypothetical protein BV20DRAFT_968774 [Pilatotrama ljubarskyi]|nr:hypothetical protein BV20DRAFT_968774 [Pilatotrama ljubarskyi]
MSPRRAQREPATIAEHFVAALLDAETFGLGAVRSSEKLKNIKLTLVVHETKGKVEGIFQDPSTYELMLTLEPVMFMRRLEVKLDAYVGDEDYGNAPTWLKRLARIQGRRVQYMRDYTWLSLFLQRALAFSDTRTDKMGVPACHEMAGYIARIKAVFDEAARRRLPPEQRVRPRPRSRHPDRALLEAIANLNLGRGAETGDVREGTVGERELRMEFAKLSI